jgi:large subunit ribosomal protein L24
VEVGTERKRGRETPREAETPTRAAAPPAPPSFPKLTSTGFFSLPATSQGPGKKWEKPALTKNGKPDFQAIHVRQGDTVQVVTGSDKGKVGPVLKVLAKAGMVVVEGVNVRTKTVQPKSKDEPGKQLSSESPLHASNVMHYSKEKGVRSRVGHRTVDGKKVRVLKKTGEVLVDRPNTKKAAAAAAEPAAE